MTESEFNLVLDSRLEAIKQTLQIKAKEYVRNDNRMHNFDRGASIIGTIREKVLWGFALKHYISFLDILDDMEKGKLPTEHLIDEKVGDLINYLILVEASIKNKIQISKAP